MTIMIGVNIHFDPADVGHHFHPAHEYGTLDIGGPAAHLYFNDIAAVDAVMTHLAELKTQMLAALPEGQRGGVLIDVGDDEPKAGTALLSELRDRAGVGEPIDRPGDEIGPLDDESGPTYGKAELRRADAYGMSSEQ